MPAWAVVRDTLKLQQILERHGVKALLQGHTHRPEEYRWHDVWYITSPAVSGAWWAGDFSGSAPGYTIFHCGADGELTWDFNMYGWEAQLDPEDETERKRNAEKLAADQEQMRLRDVERAGR
jgi:3',5'-cyclic AMP phosphodiesterase CpdA